MKFLVLVTGSVAAITVPDLVARLLALREVPQRHSTASDAPNDSASTRAALATTAEGEQAETAASATATEVRIAATQRGLRFLASRATASRAGLSTSDSTSTLQDLKLRALEVFPPGVQVFVDDDEWTWQDRGDDVLHISLRKWADVLLVAPLDANTLAKFAHGLCDNLVTCVARAWDFHKPMIVAPAMNTAMWEHPLTRQQLEKLHEFGAVVVPPVAKRLECGDTGNGAMASTVTIAQVVHDALASTITAADVPTDE